MLYWADPPLDLPEQRERWRERLSADGRTVRRELRKLRWRGIPRGFDQSGPRKDAGVFDAIDDLGFARCDLHAGDRFAVAERITAGHGLRSRALADELAGYLGSGILTRLDLKGARTVEDLAAGRSAGIDWGVQAWAQDVCLSKPLWPYALEHLGEPGLRALVAAADWGEFGALLRRKRLTERLGGAWRRLMYSPLRTEADVRAAGAAFREAVAARVQELSAEAAP
jgi:hypothetical protein